MPLPMVHLAIAVKLYEAEGKEIAPEFLLGSLAPDAIHMRQGWTREDKVATHFGLPHDYPDWTQIEPFRARAVDALPPLPAFTAGYLAHILTDEFWIEEVVIPVRPQIPIHLSQEEQRELYYRETDQVDFNFYHHAPWRPLVWEQLALAPAVEFVPLLTATEIVRWRDRTLRWFTELKEEPRIEPIYYSDSRVASFVGRAAGVVHEALQQRGLGRVF